jgi:GNAT superfamily N-acetyltransferase
MHTLVELTDDSSAIPKLIALYQRVWARTTHGFEERFQRHRSYPGFRAVLALRDEQLVAFSYGYHSLEGQYYNGLLGRALGSELSARWLSSCFELVELAVDPSSRRQGLATQLCERLLAEQPYRTAILTTQTNNHAARSLYTRLGWHALIEPFYPNTAQPFVIMVKELAN